MAGTVNQWPAGGYMVRWRTPEGRSRMKKFTRKRDADAFLVEMESSKLKGSYVDPARARILVGDWVNVWLAGKVNLKPKTRVGYQALIDVHITPRWGGVQLGQVQHSEVQEWIAGIGRAASTVRKIHAVFSMMMAAAVKDRRLAWNVAADIDLPRIVLKEKRYLSDVQVEEMAALVGPEWALMTRFLAYTGLRWGEMAALKVKRVNLQQRRVAVVEAVTEIKGQMLWGTTKGHEARMVPIPRFLLADLAGHMADKAPESLLFPGPRGAVARSAVFQRAALRSAAEAMGLCKPKYGPEGQVLTREIVVAAGSGIKAVEIPVWTNHFHPHEFRHTAASLAIASGADVKVVQEMLGHKSATMTQDLYGHLFPDRLDAVADAMDAARTRALAARTLTVVS